MFFSLACTTSKSYVRLTSSVFRFYAPLKVSTPIFKNPRLSCLSEKTINIVSVHPWPELLLDNDDALTKQAFGDLPEGWLPTQHGASGPAWPGSLVGSFST